MQWVGGMAWLQRPPTLKEFVIRSLLGASEPGPTREAEDPSLDRDTLVDADDLATTATDREPALASVPSPRPALDSIVFDLSLRPT
jgi:hypothetical protein